MSIRLSVVVPFYNEEEVAGPFLNALQPALEKIEGDHEIIAVDDGSSDSTFELLRERAAFLPQLRLVRLSRNFGHQYALMAGIDAARGDAVVTIDGDLQDPPDVIPELVAKHQEGHDVVHAVRVRRAEEPLWRRFFIWMFYRILQRISRLKAPLDSGDFRLLSRRAVDQFRDVRDANPYLRGFSGWVGFPQATVTYDRHARAAGTSKYGFFKLVQLAWNGVSALSHLPLRLATSMGLLISLSSFLLGVTLVIAKLSGYAIDPQGWTSLVTVVLFLGGVQMLMIGILGEYVGRIHDQVKKRPLYVVQEKINFP